MQALKCLRNMLAIMIHQPDALGTSEELEVKFPADFRVLCMTMQLYIRLLCNKLIPSRTHRQHASIHSSQSAVIGDYPGDTDIIGSMLNLPSRPAWFLKSSNIILLELLKKKPQNSTQQYHMNNLA